MEISMLRVRMLGDCSITLGDCHMEDTENRSRKVWLLLAYLIYNRFRVVQQQELIDLLWGEDTESANPANALKTTLHRARGALGQLGPSAGHELVVSKKGGYAWNTQVPMEVDVEEFEKLIRAGNDCQDQESRLEYYQRALQLYQGEFLNKLSSEAWVVPIAAYYHNLYTQTAQAALALLEERGWRREAVELCQAALKVEPYEENLYRHLMRNLLAVGDQRAAAKVYEEMSELLLNNFGIMPSEETQSLYREALRTINDHAVPIGIVREQLREQDPAMGAMICDYDFFKMLYQVQARSMLRSGVAVHIALLSITDEAGNELSRRSLERAMENLQDQVCSGLRRGDVAARCSVSQYILMLPQANYENSCMVCRRLIKGFQRRYPHSPANINYSVQPLEPLL